MTDRKEVAGKDRTAFHGGGFRLVSYYWQRMTRNRLAVFGLAFIIFLALVAIIGPFFTPDPTQVDFEAKNLVVTGHIASDAIGLNSLIDALEELDRVWLPVRNDWRLNERHYGALQGLNKAETARKFGDEQVLVWRRSYDVPPPALEAGDPRCEAGDPLGPPVVWIHGGSVEDSSMMVPDLEPFLPRVRALFPDTRGHGRSSHFERAEDYTYPRKAEDMLLWVDRLGIAARTARASRACRAKTAGRVSSKSMSSASRSPKSSCTGGVP